MLIRRSLALAARVLAPCLVTPTAPTAAEGPPQFDTPAHCEMIAVALGPRSERIYQGCLRIERAAHARAQALWPTVDPDTRRTCTTVASLDRPGSYKMLEVCLSTGVGTSAPSRGA